MVLHYLHEKAILFLSELAVRQASENCFFPTVTPLLQPLSLLSLVVQKVPLAAWQSEQHSTSKSGSTAGTSQRAVC
jgi:hypothetical protein